MGKPVLLRYKEFHADGWVTAEPDDFIALLVVAGVFKAVKVGAPGALPRPQGPAHPRLLRRGASGPTAAAEAEGAPGAVTADSRR